MFHISNTMETWKEFEANELTHSAAHHLLAIYEVGLEYGGWARVSDIASELGITRGSVSINLRTLKKRGFLDTDDRRLVKLSEKGQRAVQAVMAKKAVVKTFLREVLDVPEINAEIDSCKIEHLISRPTGEQLVHFMRFLVSEDPLAKEVLARFKKFQDRCPDSKTCEVCHGHCLIEELQHAEL